MELKVDLVLLENLGFLVTQVRQAQLANLVNPILEKQGQQDKLA